MKNRILLTLITILTVCMLAFSLTACDSENNEEVTQTENIEE